MPVGVRRWWFARKMRAEAESKGGPPERGDAPVPKFLKGEKGPAKTHGRG
jgi:hypothetical protein